MNYGDVRFQTPLKNEGKRLDLVATATPKVCSDLFWNSFLVLS